ncbi:uroporphyrinogen-III C-methyltransferase [Aquisalimonas sp.]|uniref:uroporphyrinogen-III C-methyltransferase n=1 Tax=Aquisalimonas sp. TaxID=1872621 RepID=UPI0025BD3264|nr:uroporphyrinogen-III C-methyltransferase [Aquisalimonas sp.]
MNDASTRNGKRDPSTADPPENQQTGAGGEAVNQPAKKQQAASGGSGTRPPDRGSGKGAGGKGRGSVALAVIALLLALLVAAAAAAGGWWLWERLQLLEAAHGDLEEVRDDYARQAELAELRDGLQSRDERLTGRVDNLAQEHSAHVQSLARVEETVATVRNFYNRASDRMDRIEELAAAHRDEWILAEAGYLFGVARYRTRFHGDVDGALQALKEADRLLEELGAETVEERQDVADAINALLDVRKPDRAAMAGELRTLVQGVDEWSLKEVERRVPPAEMPRQRDAELDTLAGWRDAGLRAWGQFRDAIGSLVVVRRDDAPPRLMAPEESHYLRENLRLQLLTARLALLDGDADVFRDSLAEVDAWMEHYFDSEDADVSAARDTVNRLREQQVRAEMPDLGEILPDRQAPGRDVREDGE